MTDRMKLKKHWQFEVFLYFVYRWLVSERVKYFYSRNLIAVAATVDGDGIKFGLGSDGHGGVDLDAKNSQ